MRRLALTLALLSAPLLALAQDPGLEALKGRFDAKEQILLSGLLANPQVAGEFANDGKSDPQSFQIKWRAKLAAFSQDYLAKEHPVNEQAHSLKEAVEPAQWGMLMATLRALKKSDTWADQAKLKIFLGMIEDADDGLKVGDARAAHKVEKTANPKLAEALTEYLNSDAAKSAVAEQKRRDDAARQELARKEQLSKDQAGRDQLAREEQARKEQATKDSVAKEQATKDQAAKDQAARTAKDQLDAAERAARLAGQKPPEQGAGDIGKSFDGGTPGGTGGTVVDGSGSQGGSSSSLMKPGKTPTLTVKPGVPSPSLGQDDDMAELASMRKEAQSKTGWRKWAAGGAGLVVGGLLGLLLGGPIGLVIGAAVLGGAAFFGAKHFWA
jgi:hypothetical protein